MSDLQLESTFREAHEFLSRLVVLWMRSFRRWLVWLTALAIAGPAAWFAPRWMPPTFETQAVMVYRETLQAESLFGPYQVRESWSQMNQRFIDTVLSCASLEVLIKELKLYPEIVKNDGMIAACVEMRRKTKIEAPPGSALVVSYRGEDPKKVHAVVARIAELLKLQPGRDAAARAEATRRFLDEQVKILKQDLEVKERGLAEFLALHPEFALDEFVSRGPRVGAITRAKSKGPGPGGRSPGSARLGGGLAARAQASPSAAPGEMKTDPTLSAAERAVADAASQLSKLRTGLTDRHPDVVEARGQLIAARAQLVKAQASAAALMPPKRVSHETPAEYEADLEEELSKAKMAARAARQLQARKDPTQTVEAVVATETRWVSLSREVDFAQEQYESVERKLFQASTLAKVESSGGQGELRTVDPAFVPMRPIARGPLRTRIFVVAGCLLLGSLIALLLTLLDDRVYGTYELKTLKIGRFVHSIPYKSKARAREQKAHA